jgi:hypothetical protein
MHHEVGARLEHSPLRFLAQLAQQAWVYKRTAWSVTENLLLQLYKINKFKQLKKAVTRGKHFVTGFVGSTCQCS